MFKSAAAVLFLLFGLALGRTVYVSARSGSDENPGTKGAPVASIWRGIELADDGDTVLVAAGTYFGRDSCGAWKVEKSISIIGSVQDKTFLYAKCGQWCNATVLKCARACSVDVPVLEIVGGKSVLVRGLVIDAGGRNSYVSGCIDTSASPKTPVVFVDGAKEIRLDGCVVANGSAGAIEIRAKRSRVEITNCSIYNTVGDAITISAPDKKSTCTLTNNRIILVWRRGRNLGRAINVDCPGKVEIAYNTIALALGGAIAQKGKLENTTIAYNRFYRNTPVDYLPVGVEGVRGARCAELCSLGFARCERNEEKAPRVALPKQALRLVMMGCTAPKASVEVKPFEVSFDLMIDLKELRGRFRR